MKHKNLCYMFFGGKLVCLVLGCDVTKGQDLKLLGKISSGKGRSDPDTGSPGVPIPGNVQKVTGCGTP